MPSTRGFQGQDFPGHGGGGFNYPEYASYLADRGFAHEVKPWTERTRQILPTGELVGPTESTVPHFLADHTISLIDRFSGGDDPFFIWHNFWGPHAPQPKRSEVPPSRVSAPGGRQQAASPPKPSA